MATYSNFFGGAFFNGGFFGAGVEDSTGGKGDNPSARGIIKPTGLIDRPKRKARNDVERRIEESRDIQAEVHEQVAREFGEETLRIALAQEPPVETMSLREIDAEIGLLLRKKLRTEDDETMLLLLMAASAA